MGNSKDIYILTILYFIISIVGIYNHELWLDEAHHWLLARDSSSIIQLIKNTRQEGHPLLWNILLFAITRFTSNPFWMQFLHILISTSVIFIFAKKSPFPLFFKILFTFGYFMIFEYNIISRNYILGVLFLFLACSEFDKRKEKNTLFFIYLGAATNVHLMFSIVAFAFFLIFIIEQIQNQCTFKKNNLLGYIFFGIGLLLLIIQIQTTQSDWLLNSFSSIPVKDRLTKGFISLFKGIFVFPEYRSIQFWNTNLLISFNKVIASIIGLTLYFLPMLLYLKNRKTLYFVYLSLLGIQIFFFITQRSSMRFNGITFIIFIMALWIEKKYNEEDFKLKQLLSHLKINLFKKPIIYSILLIHFCSGLYAYVLDFNHPFTSAKKTSEYLRENKKDHLQIVTLSCEGTPISAYLEKKIFFLCSEQYSSYCNWATTCSENIPPQEIKQKIINHTNKYNHFIFVTNKFISFDTEVQKTNEQKISMRLLKSFNQEIVKNSNYYIYEVNKKI